MKKLLFTALSVVVFSGASFAGVRENKVENKTIEIIFTNCATYGGLMADAEEALHGCMSSSNYNGVRSHFKALCEIAMEPMVVAKTITILKDDESILRSEMLKNRKK
jgi:hypothetical protein